MLFIVVVILVILGYMINAFLFSFYLLPSDFYEYWESLDELNKTFLLVWSPFLTIIIFMFALAVLYYIRYGCIVLYDYGRVLLHKIFNKMF
ncbi:hypothetical protein [Campylobacter cuniculorum]|uniref:Uncharacterized protein n=2 Tax=Campylobacter cuniculorum TaxID=374106 RepID=A0A1W6BYK0_9BACT|nr:hypothetical protein [Campylobacter cuniculorum]ARJ57110.1 hypothetical protein CCUN_1527 [Campylobacter cuniculorum DSM 23162 = LMG 24588]QOR04555.1 hypothetical protein A0071_00980 [Campylobacter cuniculorum]